MMNIQFSPCFSGTSLGARPTKTAHQPRHAPVVSKAFSDQLTKAPAHPINQSMHDTAKSGKDVTIPTPGKKHLPAINYTMLGRGSGYGLQTNSREAGRPFMRRVFRTFTIFSLSCLAGGAMTAAAALNEKNTSESARKISIDMSGNAKSKKTSKFVAWAQ